MSKLNITLGVCAMEKKATGKPMREILRRLQDVGFTIIVFEERAILEDAIEDWPLCDCLIAFFSEGYPLAKAEAYSVLRKPYVVNDLHLQWTLMDRIKMYEMLKEHNVPTPKHVICDHSDPNTNFVYHDDHVTCQGIKLKKPLVEKPRDGDDHNVRIYWPVSSGGGCTKLFRKIGDCSSEYVDDVNSVRTDGVYIYEEFVNTRGVDVKVYTCGPDYAHAEARKAPAMDGRVTRNERGKEERYPVILSEIEKGMARTVVLAFKQNICGLDILRSKSGSVVCDVNGWSFVKDSTKYWDDTAQTLGLVCRNAKARMLAGDQDEGGGLWDCVADSSMLFTTPSAPAIAQESRSKTKEVGQTPREKLLCVSIVARHADRTPKQKMKMVTRHPALLAFCDVTTKEEEVKLKQTADLQRLLEVSLALLQEPESKEVDKAKLTQLRLVLEMSPLEGVGFYRKVQLKPKKIEAGAVSEMQLILKWGGKLTWAGKTQSMDLGHELRVKLYPSRDVGGAGAGGSLLRLHATYRHDMKIYTSDEGRVIMSAAAFVKGLLDLDGALPPISAMMMQSDENAALMLDIMPEEGRVQMDNVKAELASVLHGDPPKSPEVLDDKMLQAKLDELGSSPDKCMKALHQSITNLVDELSERRCQEANAGVARMDSSTLTCAIVPHLNHSKSDPVESLDFVYTRWRKLQDEFFDEKKKRFDISKIPDIYDCSLYDILHNEPLDLRCLNALHERAHALAKFMVPLEYGITQAQKSSIGMIVTNRLLNKLYGDMHKEVDESDALEFQLDHKAVNETDIRQVDRRVHTRLYFTSESHIISLVNVLRWGHIRKGEPEGEPLLQPEGIELFDAITTDGMAFLTHIVLTVHESFDYPSDSLDRFRVRLLFSPGANGAGRPEQTKELDVTKAVPLTPPEGLPLPDVAFFFNDVLSSSDPERHHREAKPSNLCRRRSKDPAMPSSPVMLPAGYNADVQPAAATKEAAPAAV